MCLDLPQYFFTMTFDLKGRTRHPPMPNNLISLSTFSEWQRNHLRSTYRNTARSQHARLRYSDHLNTLHGSCSDNIQPLDVPNLTPHDLAINGIDGQHHIRWLGEVIGYPRLRVEWVRVVYQQRGFSGHQRG